MKGVCVCVCVCGGGGGGGGGGGLLYSLQWCSSVGCSSQFPQWHSSVAQFQLSVSSAVPVHPVVAQWYSSVHLVNQWHSSNIPLTQGKGYNIILKY